MLSLAIFIVSLLAVSTVCAANNTTNDVISVDNSDELGSVDNNCYDIVRVEDNSSLLSGDDWGNPYTPFVPNPYDRYVVDKNGNLIYEDNNYTEVWINPVESYYTQTNYLAYGCYGYINGSLNIYNEKNILVDNVSLDTSGYLSKYGPPRYSETYEVNKLPVGKYAAKIVDKYGNVIEESYINILKNPTKILVSTIKTIANSKYTLKVYLKDTISRKKINRGTLNIKINGKKYNVKIKNGVASLKFKVPSKTKTYSCGVSFKGNTIYKASSTKFKMIVKKYNSKITTKSKITLSPNAKYTLNVNVKYANGKKITSGNIKVLINGKTYSAKVSKGVAKVKIKAPSNAGTYKATVNYGGNKQIHDSSTSIKFIVKKIKYKEKLSSFTLVVPIELNEHVIRSYGVYSVETYKWVDSDVHLRIYIYKNNIRLTDIYAEAYIHFSSGEGIWVYTNDGIYNTKNTVVSNDLAIKADEVTVTVWI